jgi:superfamily II DNA or RNA helicase
MTIHLRQYQLDALAAEDEHRREHPEETRLAIMLPTGTGKTITFAERARRYITSFEGAGNRVLILVHTDELAGQAEAKVRLVVSGDHAYGNVITVGTVKADRDEYEADIVIASTQTLLDPRRRARITSVGLVIVDECELYAAPQWKAVLEHYGCFPNCTCTPYCAGGDGPEEDCPEHGRIGPTPALGFTATLERGDGQGLGEIWQNVAYSRDISWAVRKGYLVQPVGHRLEIEPPGPLGLLGLPTSDQALDEALIDGLAPEKIVEKWVELAKDRPTIAFMPLVRSARVLALCFNDAGVKAAVIYGDMPKWERRETLAAYERGDITVLVNAMVLTRGFDAPKTSCVIVGRPTKNKTLGIQMAGRGLRPVPGVPVEDQDCVLIYVQDATTDLFCHADLSDRPLDRKMQGALTTMEDQWDIGKDLADPTHLWTGQVDAKEFDPLVRRSSKVWRTTKHGTPFLPISKDREYVFVVGTSVFSYLVPKNGGHPRVVNRLHRNLPDLELAMSVAEQEAEDRGGGLGRLLADRDRPWRKQVPSAEMQSRAQQLGLGRELVSIMESRAGGKAGKVSDLISATLATRALEPMVARIKEATK